MHYKQELLEIHFAEWNQLHTSSADLKVFLVDKEINADKALQLDYKGGTEVHLREAF